MLHFTDALKLLNSEWLREIAVARRQFGESVMFDWTSGFFPKKEAPHVYFLTLRAGRRLFEHFSCLAKAFQSFLPDEGYLLVVANDEVEILSNETHS